MRLAANSYNLRAANTDAKFDVVYGCPTFSKALHFVYSRHANSKRDAASRMQTVPIAALLLLTLHAAADIREPSTRLAVSLLCIYKIILNIYVP
jgi:hypothetical protein